MYATENVIFGLNFEREILMGLHALRSFEIEKHIFSDWSVCDCYQHNSKANCGRNSKFVFCTCTNYKYDLNIFIEIGQTVYVYWHTKEFYILQTIDWISY